MGNFATASRLESGPFPPARSRGVQRDPTTKIAGGQVAGNSNLKLGDRPRTVTVTVTVTTDHAVRRNGCQEREGQTILR